MNIRPLMALALLPLMAACEMTPKTALSDDFGNSVRHNMAAQTVRPDGAASSKEYSQDGGVAALSYERYRAGKVKRSAASASNQQAGGGK